MKDKQSERDLRGVRVNKVGVKGLCFPIVVRDLAHKTQNTVATVAMLVDLPHHFKGTHMSRFVEVLNEHGRVIHVENIPNILHEMRRRLAAEYAHLQIEFPYFVEKKAPVTRATGMMNYTATFLASTVNDDMDFVLGISVPITTLCPCSKAISARGAHNQRGLVNLQVRSNTTIWIEELIRIVEQSSSSELYSLLKREDEKHVTEHAYDHPVFVEDLVRNVAVRLRQDRRVLWYRIEAENFESIHNHSAYAMVESPPDFKHRRNARKKPDRTPDDGAAG
ncbi:MAG: GTP cyclohydrolase I FolE2 [Verrucomicrobia bacterium]|nr:GTP cyclohydrolase I FolE2 [Verrucomicrobiota bacterium]